MWTNVPLYRMKEATIFYWSRQKTFLQFCCSKYQQGEITMLLQQAPTFVNNLM